MGQSEHDLPAFLLDQWLDQTRNADPKIEYDLGSSTGPVWTLRELLALDGGKVNEALLDTELLYTGATGSQELRGAIAAMYGVDPDNVQVVTGASEALLMLFFFASEPAANVVIPNPGLPSNDAMAKALNVETRYYTLRAEDGFRIDLGEIRRLVDRNTRFVLINSPHNPTGAVVSDTEMETLHDFCADRGVQLVSDEVYHPIYHGLQVQSAARLAHATVLGDFSKALCLSGLRVGWMVERDSKRRARYTNARSYFTVSNTVLGERLARLALQNRDAIYARARLVASANLALLDNFFDEYSDIVRWVRPPGGMTAFPWLRDGADAREFCLRLIKRGVLLTPGDCFGMPGHFRLGFAASGDRFPRGLELLSDFLRTEVRGRASAIA